MEQHLERGGAHKRPFSFCFSPDHTQRVQEEKEAKFKGMPDWKRKLVEKKMDERAIVQAEEQEGMAEVTKKLVQINAMPEWKRKIYLEKNPQYKELLEQQ